MQEFLVVAMIVGVFSLPFAPNPYAYPDNPEEHLSKMTPAQRRLVMVDGVLDWEEVAAWAEGRL